MVRKFETKTSPAGPCAPIINIVGEAPLPAVDIDGSDALLIAMPEYGHSLPGSLKNAIDWLIGSGELEGKLVAMTSAVPAPERGRLGLAALRDTLGAVSAKIAFQSPIVHGPDFERNIRELLLALIATAQASRDE